MPFIFCAKCDRQAFLKAAVAIANGWINRLIPGDFWDEVWVCPSCRKGA